MKKYTYDQARELIEDGDIVFVWGSWKDFTSGLIMYFTNSKFTHVFICFDHPTDNGPRKLLVEAQKGSARRILNFSFYENKYFSIIKAPKQWKEVNGVALDRVGKVKYGLLEAIYAGLSDYVWHVFRIRLPKFSLSSEYCSEFVARVYDLPEKEVSPQKLWNLLLSLGYTEK